MAKFAIECPVCGKYAEAKTGFFGTKNILCSCGNTIHVKTDKLTSRTCAHCKNDVVFDQSKGAKAMCPICHEEINTIADKSNIAEFSCEQCGIRLASTKSAEVYTCPVCDHVNHIQERMASEKIKHDGLASIIKYEGDNKTLLWKHPIEDFNLGSQLIVHESQEAVFFKDGQALDLFGAGRYTLETQQLPLLEKVYGTLTDNEGTFHSEVYYINLTTQMGIKWGTDSKVRLFDPTSGLHIEIGAGGEFNLRITNGRKLLIKLLGTGGSLVQSDIFGSDDAQNHFRALVMTNVKTYLAQTIKELQINILEIDAHLLSLSQELCGKINFGLEPYGIELPEFFISRIVTPDDDPNFRKMKEQYAQQYLNVKAEEIRKQEAMAAAGRKSVEAETEARMKIIDAQGKAEAMKIQKQAEADSYRMQAEAEAMEMKMKGYSYQQETSRQIGLEAMQNGIVGAEGGTTGGLGEIAGLGIALGSLGGIMGMTKEALNPMADMGLNMGSTMVSASDEGWNCICGQTVMGNFCSNCGGKKPETGWTCTCGQSGIIGNFCSNCGMQKPVSGWECSCGTHNTGNFCSGCGKKKGE